MSRFIEQLRTRAGRAAAWARGHRRTVAALGATAAGVACLVLALGLAAPAAPRTAEGDQGHVTTERPVAEAVGAAEQASEDEKDAVEDEGTESAATTADDGNDATDGPTGSDSAGPAETPAPDGEVPSTAPEPSGGQAATSNDGQSASHSHAWRDHTATKQVWVPNVVTVPDYETRTIHGGQLYTKQPDGTWLSNGATYWFYTDADREAFKALIVDMVRNEGYIGNYVNRTKTERVQTGSHQEDQGHYETQTYVDYQYCSCGARQ